MGQYTKYLIEGTGSLVDFDELMKEYDDLQIVADHIKTGISPEAKDNKKDTLDKFLDYVFFKVKTGEPYILNLAFPTQRMSDKILEEKIIKLLNVHLLPEIIPKILRFFSRNIKNSDTNLYLAYLLTEESLIKPIFEAFVLIRKDILRDSDEERCRSVKMMQQHTQKTDPVYSNPLDAACRFKYLLEFIAMKQNVKHLYSQSDLFVGDLKF